MTKKIEKKEDKKSEKVEDSSKEIKKDYLEELEKRIFNKEKIVTKRKLRETPKIKGETVLVKEVIAEPPKLKKEKPKFYNSWWFRLSLAGMFGIVFLEILLRKFYDKR